MARHLFIVAKEHQGLYDYLLERFAGDGNVTVVLDRRSGDRRSGERHQSAVVLDGERRLRERRQPVLPEDDLWSRSHQIVTLGDDVPVTTHQSP